MEGLLVIGCVLCTGTSIYLMIQAISTRTLFKMLTGALLLAISMSLGHALALDTATKATASPTIASANQLSPASSPMSYDVDKSR